MLRWIRKRLRKRQVAEKLNTPKQSEFEDAIERGRAVYEWTGDWESALQALRNEGHSQSAAHKVTCDVLGVSFQEGFQIVLDSVTWSDTREAVGATNEAFWAFLQEDADEFTDDGYTMSATYHLTKPKAQSKHEESGSDGVVSAVPPSDSPAAPSDEVWTEVRRCRFDPDRHLARLFDADGSPIDIDLLLATKYSPGGGDPREVYILTIVDRAGVEHDHLRYDTLEILLDQARDMFGVTPDEWLPIG
ncbi:MAG: hypothetical protein GY720_13170 [bacterium]|nr:hypothetical protein [bacterium]